MEESKNISSRKTDTFFWVLILVLILSGIFANNYFRELAWSLRFALWIVLVGVLLGLAILTSQGKKMWAFIKAAKVELRKVVWPTREETIKTTAIVATLVFVMSIVLWVVDSILLKLVNLITKQ